MPNTLIAVQGALIGACILFAWSYGGREAAVAAGYGGGVALASAWLLARGVSRAGELAKTNLRYSAYSLYFGALQRFVLVLVGLAIGLGVIRLAPIPLLASFGIAQLGYLIAAGKQALH